MGEVAGGREDIPAGSPTVRMVWESPENGGEGQGYKAVLPGM